MPTNTISGNAGAAGVTVALTGAATASTTSAADGTYSFPSLSAGAYVVTPTLTGVTFTPTFLAEIVIVTDITDANFVAQASGVFYTQTATYDFTTKPDTNPLPAPWESSGFGGAGCQNVSGFCEATVGSFVICESHYDGVVFPDNQYGEITVNTLVNGGTASVGLRHHDIFTYGYLFLSNDNGDGTQNLEIVDIDPDGSVTPISPNVDAPFTLGDVLRFEVVGTLLTGFLNGVPKVSCSDSSFTNGQVSVDIAIADPLGDALISSFRAGSVSPSYTISGSVGASGAGATIALSGAATATTTADGSGNYSFAGLAPGTYFVTPGLTGHAFSPSNRTVVVVAADVPGVNFTLFTPSQSGSNSASIMATGPLFATRIVSPRTEIVGTNLGTEIRK